MPKLYVRDLFALVTIVALSIMLGVQMQRVDALRKEVHSLRWRYSSLEETLDKMGYRITVDDEGPWKYVGVSHKFTPKIEGQQ